MFGLGCLFVVLCWFGLLLCVVVHVRLFSVCCVVCWFVLCWFVVFDVSVLAISFLLVFICMCMSLSDLLMV